MKESSIPVIAIVGPTASGKSALAVFLAQKLGGEIISADSRQVYRGLDIGTGKITPSEMDGIPHHLLNVVDPVEQYSVTEYRAAANGAIGDIGKRGKIPVVCGGTGQYIDTLLEGIEIPDVPPNPALRRKLESKSTEELYTLLTEKDPARAATIDRHNPRRLVRALEIVETLGRVPKATLTPPPYQVIWIGISLSPPELREKIEKRLDDRLAHGLVKEVQKLHKKNGLSWERLDALGLEYRYVARHLKGDISYEKMREELLLAIVDYARRQLRWFKRNKRIHWVESPEEALRVAKSALS